jgi:hypothetical protein
MVKQPQIRPWSKIWISVAEEFAEEHKTHTGHDRSSSGRASSRQRVRKGGQRCECEGDEKKFNKRAHVAFGDQQTQTMTAWLRCLNVGPGFRTFIVSRPLPFAWKVELE